MRALGIIDLQKTFIEGGELPVSGGVALGEQVAAYLKSLRGKDNPYELDFVTRDSHVDPKGHFSETPDFIDTWPVHGMLGSRGHELHDALEVFGPFPDFHKGHYTAAYSGFEGHDENGVYLAPYLRERGVTAIDLCGIATDHCVKATALDGLREGFSVRILANLCIGITDQTVAAALEQMEQAGCEIAQVDLGGRIIARS